MQGRRRRWASLRAMPRRAAFALLGAAGALGLLFLTWFLAFHVGVFRRADLSILGGFEDLHRPRVDPIASFVANLCNPQPYAYLAAAPVLLALGRRRPRVALAIVAIVFGANLTTQLLKPLLAEHRAAIGPEMPIGAASWPSGHATAAMSLALCSVLAAPSRLRPVVSALGAAFAVAVSYSFLTLGWHYPSDVFGGFLVATAWTLAAVAALFASNRAGARRETNDVAVRASLAQTLRAPAGVLLGAIALAGLLSLIRPATVLAYARAHETFMVGAASIGALGLALATGVLLTLRR